MATVRFSPRGTAQPGIYFIGDTPNAGDTAGLPFTDSASRNMQKTLDILSINELNCRYNYCVRDIEQDENKNYITPTDEDFEKNRDFLYNDILASNPKVIVLMGGIASKFLIGERFIKLISDRGKIFEVDINGKIFKAIPTYHQSFILKNSDREDVQFSFRSDIKTAMRVCLTDSVEVDRPLLQDNQSQTVEIYDYWSFNDFCERYIDPYDTVGYDIETNALEVHSQSYKVVGFSLASDSKIGCYVVLNSIDFNMSENQRIKIEERLRNILKRKRVIVYNCMHELPATLNWLNLEIPNFEDLLIMVKLMMGTAKNYEGNGGLKEQCMLHLSSKDWSEDLDTYVSAIKSYKADRENALLKARAVLGKYYKKDALDIIMRDVERYAEDIIPNAPEFSYGFIPCKLIARYGSIDSSILFELKDFYENWMKNEGEKLGINLFTGYKYWKMHHYAGYVLERNGAYWNDDKAKVVEKWCEDGMLETLRNIIKSPLMLDYLKIVTKSDYEKYLFENYCDRMLDSQKYTIKRKYAKSVGVVPNSSEATNELKRMSLEPNKQGVYKLLIGNIIAMGKDFIKNSTDIYVEWFKKYLENATSSERTFDELKSIVNPNSTSPEFRDYVSSMLIKPIIKCAKFYDNIAIMVDDPNFNLNDFLTENKDDYGSCRLVSMIYKFKTSDISISERFDWFLDFLNNKPKFKNKKVIIANKKALDYKFENMDSDTLNTIYELYLMLHIDVENRETWNPEFEWMFNFKMFKKFSKLLSTYINGTVGRKNVYEVDKASYSNGDILTRRERKYQKGVPISENKQLLMQANFKVNMADTGRWTCGMHNLPASDAIKGIFTSRFPGGCIAMPDGCLVGDTKIRLADGTSPKIKDLVGLDKFYVYSYDTSTNRYVIAKGHSCREVKKVNKLYKITLNNGKSVICTIDHKFFSNNVLDMVEANQLKIGDSISHLEIKRKVDNFGKEREYVIHPNGKEEFTYLLADKYNVEQSLYDDVVYELGFINRHHIDFNVDNNSPENIARISPQEHGRIHGTEIWRDREYRERMLEKVKRQWEDDDFRNLMLNVSKKYGAESFRKSNYDERCIELRKIGNRKYYNNNFFKTIYELINKFNISVRDILINGERQYDTLVKNVYGKCIKGSGIRTIKSQNITLYQYLCDNIYELLDENTDFESVINDLSFINNIQQNGDKKEISIICNSFRKCDEYCKNNYIVLNENNFFDVQNELGFNSHKRDINTVNKYFGNFNNLVRYAKDNHYITKIETIKTHNEPVYCFQVDVYHNYYLDCGILSSNSQMEVRTLAAESKDESLLKAFADGVDIHRFFASKIYSVPYEDVQKWQRGLAKNAVFGMLYGESEQTFADSYLGGDLSKAKEVYNGMFAGFPRIKDYIERKHQQYKSEQKVTTLTQRFINLASSKDDPDRVMRQSQNFPIQASAEDIAGVILYKLCEWLRDNQMKSKPFCFIHDSIEIDMHPDEVFQILEHLNYLFNVFPREEFGVPVACDVPLSMSMGAEIEVVKLDHSDDFNDIVITLHGFEDDINELLENWRSVYKVVEEVATYEPEEPDKSVYMPIAERFLPRKSPISMKQGTYRNNIERQYHIVLH